MQSTPSGEHFVTVFDSAFLPQGLALASSLQEHCPTAALWVICVDDDLTRSLSLLGLENVRPIELKQIETAELRRARRNRTMREYCWTLTPFSFDAVFSRSPEAKRVTYVDADLFFFDNARPLFQELELSGASVLVTEHNFDPRYDRSATVGRFCVQFLTMDRSQSARNVRRWWQERVLEWCHDRIEPGRFGDQKYLDQWPVLFPERIHILQRQELAVAPWNAAMEARANGGSLRPVFYHFHSFRIVALRRARLVEGGYELPPGARPLYDRYKAAIEGGMRLMRAAGINIALQPIPTKALPRLRHVVKRALGRADRFARLSTVTW